MSTVSAAVLRRMQERAVHADQLLHLLKSQLETLQKDAVVKACLAEEEKIKKENEVLRNEVTALRARLVNAEIKNGVPQVALPQTLKSASTLPLTKLVPAVKAEKKVEPAEVKPPVKTESKENKTVQKETKKELKKENKQEKKAEPAKSAENESTDVKVDVSRLNMRIGRIVNVQKHPDADSLYVEEVDVGETKPRTIVSGLVKHVPLEEMQNRIAVFLLNLKPAKMRGILSEGMIMCASSPEKVEIIVPPEGVTIGERVTVEGYAGQPDEQLNPKKKTWEQIQPDLKINNDGLATYKGALWKIEGKGTFKAPSMTNSAIK